VRLYWLGVVSNIGRRLAEWAERHIEAIDPDRRGAVITLVNDAFPPDNTSTIVIGKEPWRIKPDAEDPQP
jgi:hypothetical protein